MATHILVCGKAMRMNSTERHTFSLKGTPQWGTLQHLFVPVPAAYVEGRKIKIRSIHPLRVAVSRALFFFPNWRGNFRTLIRMNGTPVRSRSYVSPSPLLPNPASPDAAWLARTCISKSEPERKWASRDGCNVSGSHLKKFCFCRLFSELGFLLFYCNYGCFVRAGKMEGGQVGLTPSKCLRKLGVAS